MNHNEEEFADLEAELKQLVPQAPSKELHLRIEDALEEESGSKIVPFHIWTLRLAVAALVLLFAGLTWKLLTETPENPNTVTAPEDEPEFVTIQTSNVLLSTQDGGIVVTPDQIPVRRVRFQHVDSYQLRDRKSNAVITISQPRDSFLDVPIEIY